MASASRPARSRETAPRAPQEKARTRLKTRTLTVDLTLERITAPACAESAKESKSKQKQRVGPAKLNKDREGQAKRRRPVWPLAQMVLLRHYRPLIIRCPHDRARFAMRPGGANDWVVDMWPQSGMMSAA